MAIGISSVGHAFASVGHDILTGAKAVVSWEQRKIRPNETQIEALTGLIPGYGPQIELIELLAFAAFGAVVAVLHIKDVVSSS